MQLLPEVPSGSVDMVLCDLPYGITQNAWDSVIDLPRLWAEYKRVLRPNGVVVLTASQPFTTTLVSSNRPMFKYSWVWDKKQVTNFLNAKRQPLRRVEDVLVFYAQQCVYNPQMRRGEPYQIKRKHTTDNYGAQKENETLNCGERYPDGIIEISQVRVTGGHPTQKPVALFEYLIRTYTNEGDTVLDNCCGSGTTGVACQNTDRNFIQMELDPEYCEIARSRLRQTDPASALSEQLATAD